jgi:hypothetical protein
MRRSADCAPAWLHSCMVQPIQCLSKSDLFKCSLAWNLSCNLLHRQTAGIPNLTQRILGLLLPCSFGLQISQRIALVDGPYCWRHSESGIFISGGSPREGETLAIPGAPGSIFGKDGTLNQSRCSIDVPWMSTIRYYASHRGKSGTSACLEGSKP